MASARQSKAADRVQLANVISERLRLQLRVLRTAYQSSSMNYFVVDDLLGVQTARAIHDAFPGTSQMMLRKSLRELKYVTSQMDRTNPLVEEAVYAFQDSRVVSWIGEITGMRLLEPDTELYAGGISVMGPSHFLNPHIDNSHDRERKRYRVLNLLYYVSPDWTLENGGNLELWPEGPQGKPLTIESRCDRLVVMATTRSSWHSVSSVNVDRLRCCVSNYYFSSISPEDCDYFHITSFRGRPEQKLRDVVLRGDIALRSAVRKLAKLGLVKTKHYYKK